MSTTLKRMQVFEIGELGKLLASLKCTLYSASESERDQEIRAHLTKEFFYADMFRLVIIFLPELDLEARKYATYVVATLQRQKVHSRLIACDYLEANTDLLDIMVSGYENHKLALHYGDMLRECSRHQSIAKYVLESHWWKFLDYIQLPNFDVASDAAATFEDLLTQHKSTVAEFLSKNYEWFFREFNSKLLDSPIYIARRLAIKLLGDILLEPSNVPIMSRYVSSRDNFIILMNLLRDPSELMQLEAFCVFKLFVINQNMPHDIAAILIVNRSKLFQYLGAFKIDKGTGLDRSDVEQFEADKDQIVKVIAELQRGGI